MNTTVSRRDFLRRLGVGAGAAAVAVATTKLPKMERQPKKGERFRLWTSPTANCLECEAENEISEDIYAVYSGKSKDGEHVFLIENAIRCSGCRKRTTRYVCSETEFVEAKDEQKS